MKILITGAEGKIGSTLCANLIEHDIIGLSHSELDVTNGLSVENVKNLKPDLIINCAVIGQQASNEDKATSFRVNTLGVKNLLDTGIRLLQISTIAVFSDDNYGFTKKWAEDLIDTKVHTILRFSPVREIKKSRGDTLLADVPNLVRTCLYSPGIYNSWNIFMKLKAFYAETKFKSKSLSALY